jgi:hypothetical protein
MLSGVGPYKIRGFSNPFFVKGKPHLLKHIGDNIKESIKIKNINDKKFVDFNEVNISYI